MTTAASTPARDLSHVSEVLEIARSIVKRHDDHLTKKMIIMQGFLELSERYPERDYSSSINRALAELIGAVHLHLNAEPHEVTAVFARLSETTPGQIGVTQFEPGAAQECGRLSASVWGISASRPSLLPVLGGY